MKPSDKPAFAQLLTDALAFYRQDVSTFALGVWWQACEAFELEQVAKALTAHALDPDRGQFAPKPADLIRQLQGESTERALVAWGQVIAAARSGGGRFDGPTQEAIESMGGMGRLRMANESENGFLQSQFVAAFKAYKHRDDAAALLPSSTSVRRLGGEAA